MNTLWMLMGLFGGKPVVPVEDVRRNFFAAYEATTFLRKLAAGDIPLPVVRLDGSQKGPKGVHLTDLAAYLDKQAEAARKEARKLAS